MTQAPSLARTTVRNSVFATLAAIMLVVGINLYFVASYQPQYTANAEVSMWTYRMKHAEENSRNKTKPQPDDDELKEARESAARRMLNMESLLESADGMQAAENACRAAGLTLNDYQPSQFNERVSIQQAGLSFAISFSCDDAQIAATVANGLADWCAGRVSANSYEKTFAYFKESIARQATWKTIVNVRVKSEAAIIDGVKKSDPKYDLDRQVQQSDVDRMQILAAAIATKHLDEVITRIRIKTLDHLNEITSHLYDAAELARLQRKLERLGQERQKDETEINTVWKGIAKDDPYFPRIEAAKLETYKARRTEQQLREEVDLMEKDVIFQVTEVAATPDSPSTGRPALAMILLCGLAIALPYLVAFVLSRRADGAVAL